MTINYMRKQWAVLWMIAVVLILQASMNLLLASDLPATYTAKPVRVAPASLAFGSQVVGSVSAPKTATFTNASSSIVSIHDIIASGIDFSQTNTCAATLAPGNECAVQITFKPATTGLRLGTVTIFDSDSSSPHMVAVSGTGE
jgi:hypothetical protein